MTKPIPKIANVNDGYLIITLTQSITPVVWRLELEKAKVAAFEIVKKDKKHTLTIKVASKSLEAIGTFKDPEEALEALLSISEALQNVSQKTPEPENIAIPHTEKTETSSKNESKPKNNRVVIALLATCIVLGLFYYYWGKTIPTTQTFETQSITNNSNPATQTGVPVDADDLLKGF